jgi:1-acyl-sn-glycerol-3-phosphate acyltransferase
MKFLSKILFSIFFPYKIIGKENIPKEGRIILAGNHTNNLDSPLLIRVVKRKIHFIAKKELLDSKFSFIYKKIGIIPVDRKSHNNKESLDKAIECLKNDEVIVIFPEGTFNKTEYIVKPFKIGAVYLACNSDSKIVPFAIKGKYKWFRRGITIEFGKPYYIKDKKDLRKENITLTNKVIRLIRNGSN